MRSRLSSASDCWPPPEPPPKLPDLHLVDASAPALVNKWFSDRLYVECLADVALVAFAFCPLAAAFVIQCDNGSESVRAFSYVPVDSGSWHSNRDRSLRYRLIVTVLRMEKDTLGPCTSFINICLIWVFSKLVSYESWWLSIWGYMIVYINIKFKVKVQTC